MTAAFAAPNAIRTVEPQVNVTPLVDVLLVLLVIFVLSVPIATQRLPLSNASWVRDCPQAHDPVRVAIKATGEIYWNGVAVSSAALAANLVALMRAPQPPALELHPERGVRYERVTDVLAAARNAGVQQIGITPTGE